MFILFHSAALIFFLFFFGIFIIFSLHISAGTYFEVPFEHFAEVLASLKPVISATSVIVYFSVFNRWAARFNRIRRI